MGAANCVCTNWRSETAAGTAYVEAVSICNDCAELHGGDFQVHFVDDHREDEVTRALRTTRKITEGLASAVGTKPLDLHDQSYVMPSDAVPEFVKVMQVIDARDFDYNEDPRTIRKSADKSAPCVGKLWSDWSSDSTVAPSERVDSRGLSVGQKDTEL